jgi:integrase/recombinase XerD
MEAEGQMRSTVARRLSTLASFYRYCHVEGVPRRNTATNVRRPKVDHESQTLGLDRNEPAPCWSGPGSALPAITR